MDNTECAEESSKEFRSLNLDPKILEIMGEHFLEERSRASNSKKIGYSLGGNFKNRVARENLVK